MVPEQAAPKTLADLKSDAPNPDWHRLEHGDVASHWRVDPRQGLSQAESRRRRAQHGDNKVRQQAAPSPLSLFLAQFADVMILILIAAAIVSGVVGDLKDTIAITVIVVLNAVIGFVQEMRAQRAMAALAQIGAGHAQVRRDGRMVEVSAAEVAPGDIVHLQAGSMVPADLRLIEANQMRIDESVLTGESVAIEKHHRSIADIDAPLGDRRNMAFRGTFVSQGRGLGIAVATGMATEIGKIATLMDTIEELRTPLQQRLAQFGRRIALAVLAVCAVIFAGGLLRGEPPVQVFLTAISLAVAAIPEALPAVVTISLALGAAKMARQNALIRRLPAVETLGSVTVICSDKTGTLTQNRMQVDALRTGMGANAVGGEPWRSLYRAMALNNDCEAGAEDALTGDPTEIALAQNAVAAGFARTKLEGDFPRLDEIPFESDRKRMTTLHPDGGGFASLTKGAPESVIPLCDSLMMADGAAPLDRAAWLAEAERMAANGLRVLALAQRGWDARPDMGDAGLVESGMVLLGLAGLIDPPRPEAMEAIGLCQSAGITPVMITGDHPATAAAIARRLGICDDGVEIVTGAQLAGLGDGELFDRAGRARVYARVDPAQKIRIVEALQKRGEFVAMTGDGVNDAPALRQANIGVAMGKSGTDVAREASSLVLLDDNFATIVAAVREGRRIYDNIRKFVRFVMIGNSAEVWTIFLAPLLGMPIPLLPIQLLWINLVTDGLPGLALAAEPAEPGVMRRPPRPPGESVFAHGLGHSVIWLGLAIAGLCLFVQAAALQAGWHWQTMVFTVLTLSQMALALAVRSERDSLFRQGLMSNPPLLGAVGLTLALQLAVIYWPPLRPIFNTQPLGITELAVCVGLSLAVFALAEIEKAAVRAGWLYRAAK